MKLKDLIMEYFGSYEFKNLREDTKKQYVYFLSVLTDSRLDDSKIGNYQLKNISTKMCKVVYKDWCERGVSLANHVLSVSKIAINYAIDMEYMKVNPFRSVKKQTTKPRKVVWTKEDIQTFLEVAYSNFETRNVGLIAQMAYEWCQRLGDMRMLTWSNLDLEAKTMHIEQSKRRAEVFLPISDGLTKMLLQQKQDYGFQKYVAPRPKPYRGEYQPYSLFKLPLLARKVMNLASLSDELRLCDLRRTGTTEMVDAGVSMANIMSVTGHANPQSVKPYMKHTLASASLALNMRNNLTEN